MSSDILDEKDDDLGSLISALEKRNNELEMNLAKAFEDNQKLQKDLRSESEKRNQEVLDMQGIHDMQNDFINKMECKNNEADELRACLQEAAENLERVQQNLEDEFENNQKLRASMNDTVHLQKREEALAVQIETLTQENKLLQGKVEEADFKLMMQKGIIESTKGTLTAKEKALKEEIGNQKNANDSLEKMQKKIQKLEKKLQSKKQILQSKEAVIEKLKDEDVEKEQKFQEHINSEESLHSKIEKLTKEVEREKEKVLQMSMRSHNVLRLSALRGKKGEKFCIQKAIDKVCDWTSEMISLPSITT